MTSHPLSTCHFKGQHALLSSASADTPPSPLLPSPLPSPLGKQSSPRGSHVADHTMHQPCSHSVQTPILSVSFCSFCSKHLLALSSWGCICAEGARKHSHRASGGAVMANLPQLGNSQTLVWSQLWWRIGVVIGSVSIKVMKVLLKG